jgi:acyl-[acyl-carrier-protein]-phospholipid O-acyltransferase/long-chain-fatty-acid--[acyl-carrier-protein] ligase
MWTALSLGAFADNMLRQALMIGIAFGWIGLQGAGETESAIPLIGSVFAASMLVFSSIAGQVADKYETQTLFRWTKFTEVILMALAALGFFLNDGWLLILTLFAMAAQSAFFSPVRQGAMRKYLETNELIRANGLCNAGLYASIVAGLFFGGLLIAQDGGRMAVAGALFAASFTGFLAILGAPKAPPTAPDLALRWNPLVQGADMVRRAFAARGVARPILGWCFFFYVSTLMTVLTPLSVKNSLNADGTTATYIMGAMGVGAGLGGIAAALLSRKRSGLGYSALGVAGSAAVLFAGFLLTPYAASEAPQTAAEFVENPAGLGILMCFMAGAALLGLFVAPLQAAVQRRAPAVECARILATGNMLNAAAALLGSLSVLGVTETGIDPKWAIFALALLEAGVALYMYRRQRSTPDGLYDEMLSPGPEAQRGDAALSRAGQP